MSGSSTNFITEVVCPPKVFSGYFFETSEGKRFCYNVSGDEILVLKSRESITRADVTIAFCNRRRTSIKILQWDGSGFWILMKRLDRNAFHWPDTPDELRQVTLKEIHWMCDGLSLNSRGAFEEHHPKIIL